MPGPLDPVHDLSPATHYVAKKPSLLSDQIEGWMQADMGGDGEHCRAIVAVERLNGLRRKGRTELLLSSCHEPVHQGWRIKANGVLKEPSAGPHSLLPGAAERLASQGCWSQLWADHVEVIMKPMTPIADIRRKIAGQMISLAGPSEGGLLAAFVLGGAQVPLPFDLRHDFRVAGLSHVVAASGFHLSVLLGISMAFAHACPRCFRLLIGVCALVTFLLLAGPQPSVLRAMLMGMVTIFIEELGGRQRPFGVLLAIVFVMLVINPALALSIGFQLSAAATSGLVLSAEPIEAMLASRMPTLLHSLLPALSVPLAATIWTLPLQVLHFGAIPIYGLLANLVCAPLVGLLTIASMLLALLGVLLPQDLLSALLPAICWPIKHLATLLIASAHLISGLPFAELLTGRTHRWIVLPLLFGLWPWCLPSSPRWRACSTVVLLSCALAHVWLQSLDQLILVQHHGRHWLLALHQGRAALLSSHGDQRSCRLAHRLSRAYGYGRLDWVMLMDPLPVETFSCWDQLSAFVQAKHHGQAPLQKGQILFSPGLELRIIEPVGRALELSVGQRRVSLFPSAQSFRGWQALNQGRLPQYAIIEEMQQGNLETKSAWLGFFPTREQQHWLKRHSFKILSPSF